MKLKWLVCCSNTNLHLTKNKLFEFNFASNTTLDFLEVLKITAKKLAIDKLTNMINSYNFVVFVSPSSINFAKKAISRATISKFLVMGKNSFDLLSEHTNNTIYYPKYSTGVNGLQNEVLTKITCESVINKKILVIYGDKSLAYESLISSLKNKPFKQIDSLSIYKQAYIDFDIINMRKIIDNSIYQGIIVTSSGILSWLMNQANKYKFKDELLNMRILSWHESIINKIKAYK